MYLFFLIVLKILGRFWEFIFFEFILGEGWDEIGKKREEEKGFVENLLVIK